MTTLVVVAGLIVTLIAIAVRRHNAFKVRMKEYEDMRRKVNT